MRRLRSPSLGTIASKLLGATPEPPELPKPEPRALDLLVTPGTNPNRMRVGKSGEIGRNRGRRER